MYFKIVQGDGRTRESMTAVTAKNRCPVCNCDHKCSVGDGGLIICGRKSGDQPGFRSLGEVTGDPQFHLYRRLEDNLAVSQASVSSVNTTAVHSKWAERARDYSQELTSELREELARQLGLPVEVFGTIPSIGYLPDESCWTFPECDGQGRIIGISRRFRNRKKKSIQGSKRGLTIPRGWESREGPVFIVEGPSDTLALTAAGLSAIGRPSNTGGGELLAELLRDLPAKRTIVVLGENDQKEDGQWPGRDGAKRVAQTLTQTLQRDIETAFPPAEFKDARVWLTSEGLQALTWEQRGQHVCAELLSRLETIAAEPTLLDAVNPAESHLESGKEDAERALRFAQEVGERVRFVADWGCFVLFDGKRWLQNPDGGLVIDLARQIGHRIKKEASQEKATLEKAITTLQEQGSEAELEAAQKRLQQVNYQLELAKKWLNNKPMQEMLKLFRNLPGTRIEFAREVFDCHPHLLTVPNGTLDLRTGMLRPHNPADYLTTLCPTEFDPQAPCPRYEQFLAELFPDRPAISEFLARWSGYILTGETTDQSFVLFTGDGANGKSILLEIWPFVLGPELSYHAPVEVLLDSNSERHPTERASFCGKRLTVCSETEEEAALNEKRIKALTGGDTMTARFMRQDFFSFQPTHKVFLATNHKPRIRGTDNGIWRRVRLVEFTRRFWTDADRLAKPDGEYRPEDRADESLLDKLKAEAKGILASMVRNAVKFYQANRKVEAPAEVMEAVAEYRKTEDLLGQFFDQRVRVSDSESLTGTEFYQAYTEWSKQQGYAERFATGPRKFGIEAKKRFASKKASSSRYGVRILSDQEVEREEGRIGGQNPVDVTPGTGGIDGNSSSMIPLSMPIASSHPPSNGNQRSSRDGYRRVSSDDMRGKR